MCDRPQFSRHQSACSEILDYGKEVAAEECISVTIITARFYKDQISVTIIIARFYPTFRTICFQWVNIRFRIWESIYNLVYKVVMVGRCSMNDFLYLFTFAFSETLVRGCPAGRGNYDGCGYSSVHSSVLERRPNCLCLCIHNSKHKTI